MSYGFGRVNDLAFSILKNAENKGFYEDYAQLMQHEHLTDDQKEFITRIWLSHRLMLIVSELSEALEGVRSNNFSSEIKSGGVMEELSDAAIRLFDLGEHVQQVVHQLKAAQGVTNLEQSIVNKMEYNASRPYRHGRKL